MMMKFGSAVLLSLAWLASGTTATTNVVQTQQQPQQRALQEEVCQLDADHFMLTIAFNSGLPDEAINKNDLDTMITTVQLAVLLELKNHYDDGGESLMFFADDWELKKTPERKAAEDLVKTRAKEAAEVAKKAKDEAAKVAKEAAEAKKKADELKAKLAAEADKKKQEELKKQEEEARKIAEESAKKAAEAEKKAKEELAKAEEEARKAALKAAEEAEKAKLEELEETQKHAEEMAEKAKKAAEETAKKTEELEKAQAEYDEANALLQEASAAAKEADEAAAKAAAAIAGRRQLRGRVLNRARDLLVVAKVQDEQEDRHLQSISCPPRSSCISALGFSTCVNVCGHRYRRRSLLLANQVDHHRALSTTTCEDEKDEFIAGVETVACDVFAMLVADKNQKLAKILGTGFKCFFQVGDGAFWEQ